MSSGPSQKKKKRHVQLTRDIAIRRLNNRQARSKPSQLAVLKEVFEEAKDRGRFVGDTMFWKYFEDLNVDRIYHTDSVEYRNLKVMCCETMFYVVLLICITAYAYSMQAWDVYDARQQQVDYWSGCDADGNCKIAQVDDMSSFWNWMQTELVEQAFTPANNSGAPPVATILTQFPQNDFTIKWYPRFVGPATSNVLLGSIRIRQLRVERNKGCHVSQLFGHAYPDCFGPYGSEQRSTVAYAPRYAPSYLSSCYVWQNEEKTKQGALLGDQSTYGGDGFMFELPVHRSEASVMLSDLREWHWIDRATRAIVLELTTLNVNVDKIVNTRILFEFGPTGSIQATVRSKAASIFFFTPSLKPGRDLLVFLFQILMLITFLMYCILISCVMYKTCGGFLGERPFSKMCKAGCKKSLSFLGNMLIHYYRYGWNIVDLFIIILFWIHAAYRMEMYAAKSREPMLAPTVIGHPEKFMPFSHLMAKLEYSTNALAVLLIFAWVKLFKYLCMSSYFRMLVRILERCAVKLCVFLVLLLFLFIGFAVAFSVIMGSHDPKFATVPGSFLLLCFYLTDGYDVVPEWFDPGREQLMPVVFVMYIAVIYFVLMNIFLAIVLDVYATAWSGTKLGVGPNPMIVFLRTWWNMRKGLSLVQDTREHNLPAEDLSIRLERLPGIARRKWIDKKRRLQRIARENFQGMELYPDMPDIANTDDAPVGEWTLPSCRKAVQQPGETSRPKGVYDVPPALLKEIISRDQLQRLMDEDSTLPILLGSKSAVVSFEGSDKLHLKLQMQMALWQLATVQSVEVTTQTSKVKRRVYPSSGCKDTCSEGSTSWKR